jgi:hypothetical protein
MIFLGAGCGFRDYRLSYCCMCLCCVCALCLCVFCVCVYYVLAGGTGAVASQGSLASIKRRAVKGFAPVEAVYQGIIPSTVVRA